MENVKSFSELLNSNILEANKKIVEIITNISDLKNNLEIAEKEKIIIKNDINPVSYTHLTLPTNREV